MRQKTKKQLVYEYILKHGPMVSSQAADALGFPRVNTGSMTSHMAATGLLKQMINSENSQAARIYEAIEGAWVEYVPPKAIRHFVYDYIKKQGPMTSSEVAKGLDINGKSVSAVLGQMVASGALAVVGKKGKGRSGARIYKAVKGARPQGKGRASIAKDVVKQVVVIEVKEGVAHRDAKIRTHDEYKASLCAAVSKLGSGPFGLMAAQLGAGA